MENSPFGAANHLPSQALVVLSEAASGLHEVLRNQRPFQTRMPDVKEIHNMSLVGNYSSHILHSFHPHLLQSLNSNMLTNGGPGNFFASDRNVSKPILSSFQLPSAFSPPKYIGISLDQNLFSGSESFRTDSTSPTCTSVSPLTKNDSLEGQSEYEGDKGESPRSNPDIRDFRHVHIKSNLNRSAVPETCPVCGIQLSAEEWNTHFLTELDRLYKLSSGMDRSNMQSDFLFGTCTNQDNSLRTSQSRWETFQRIRSNRQSRLRIKVRKRKCGDLYLLENLFCNSCPICRRKLPLDGIKNNVEEDNSMKDEIETVDVESCGDEVPDSGSEVNTTNSKVDGMLYKSVCLINKDLNEDVSNSWDSINNFNGKMGNELSSTTPQLYNADSCGDRACKSSEQNSYNNESDEDVIVDDDSVKICRKRKFDELIRSDNNSSEEDRQSEPQVTSTEQPDSPNKFSAFEDLRNGGGRMSSSATTSTATTTTTTTTTDGTSSNCADGEPSLRKTGKDDDDYKCFICKTGLEKCSNFFRGRTLYFHQDCANVMSGSSRLCASSE